MPPIDSSFVLAVSKGPSSFDEPIIPALMLATSYLNSLAGPLWKAIRGTGLAYGASFSRHVDSGQMSLYIGSSPDPYKAFAASKMVLESLVVSDHTFDSFALEAAYSSVVSGFAYSEVTRVSAAESSFVRQVMRGLPKEWPSLILEKVRNVTVEEIKTAMKDVILPIFEAKTVNLFITCAPLMEQKVVKGFSEIGFTPDVKPLAFFYDDYRLDGEGGLDEESEDDDDLESEGSEESEDEI